MARSRRRKPGPPAAPAPPPREPDTPPRKPDTPQANPLGQLTPQLLGVFAAIVVVLFLLNYLLFGFELVSAILTALVIGSFAAMPWMGYQNSRNSQDPSD